MAHYTCGQCLYTTKEPICPSCNAFLTNSVALAESCMKAMRPPVGDIDWCTAFGHWGDIFVCCGVMKALMAHTGQEKVNVLYVGPDIAIVDWLELQPFVGQVIGIKSTEGDFYKKFWGATTQPNSEPETWLSLLREQMRGLPKANQYTCTHINSSWFETRTGLQAQLWKGGILPQESHLFAQDILRRTIPIRNGAVYHLHPVSTWSESANNHWAHWLASIEWLVEKTPHTYVLTGLENIPFCPKSPKLINLVGQTKSNLDVLAISQECDGVISTPNSVAIWSVIAGQKCLSIGNFATQFLTSYYRRFLERGETMTYLNVDCTFSKFQAAACEFLEG